MSNRLKLNKVVFCFHTNDHEYNFGIGFISAFLKEHGADVDIAIFREVDGSQVDSPESVAARILAKKPEIVGFSVMTFNWHRIKPVMKSLRKLGYKGLIVVGGYHAILDTDDVVAQPEVDVVCIGEGEQPMLDLLSQYAEQNLASLNIDGLIIKANKKPSVAPRPWMVEDLDDYPYTDYDLFAEEDERGLDGKFIGTFSAGGIYSLAMTTGRGCPYRCAYCSNSFLIDYYGGSKQFIRRFSPGKVVANIKNLVGRYEPQFIEFLDETFAMDRAWVKDFCTRYKRDVGLPFSIMNRIDNLNEDVVEILVDAGLKVVLFGLESGDEHYRGEYLNRKIANSAIIMGAELLRKRAVKIVTFNMFGMPFETEENILKTFTLNEKVRPDAAIPFIYQPFPKTRLGELAKEHGMVTYLPDGRWDYCSPSLETGFLSKGRVVELVSQFREKFCNEKQVSRLYAALKGACLPNSNV